MKKPTPASRIVNLISEDQVEAIIDGVEKSAFTVAMEDSDDTIATLSTAGKVIFIVNLTRRVISRKRGSSEERTYSPPAPRFFVSSRGLKLFDRLEAAIKTQYALGGQEALTKNLISRSEVVVLIDAIRAMAFRIEKTSIDLFILYFDGRECFRIETVDKYITLVGLSNSAEIVYGFAEEPAHWFWAGTDRKLWRELQDALSFYHETMHRVRMSDYRAMFGNQMQKVITSLAAAMDEAEAEVRMLEKVDRTNSGRNLHPDVARLVQKDLDAGEEQANQEDP